MTSTRKMTLTRKLALSAATGGIAVAGLLSAGAGTALAAPGQPCGQPGAEACRPAPAAQSGDWQHRDINAGRQDHQPFLYQGQRVAPQPAGNGDGWGFWFLGRWIRL